VAALSEYSGVLGRVTGLTARLPARLKVLLAPRGVAVAGRVGVSRWAKRGARGVEQTATPVEQSGGRVGRSVASASVTASRGGWQVSAVRRHARHRPRSLVHTRRVWGCAVALTVQKIVLNLAALGMSTDVFVPATLRCASDHDLVFVARGITSGRGDILCPRDCTESG
jgi:hypothetical protein